MFEITLINMTDGSVQGHRAGCADVKRGKNHAETWTVAVSSKRDAFLNYNADFLDEGQSEDEVYQIDWLPCADHVPSTDEVAAETIDDIEGVTAKTGRKWTNLYAADGSLIAELRNDQLDAIREFLAL